MLRVGAKRRRTKQELLEEKEATKKKEELIQGKLAEYVELKAKADEVDQMKKQVEQAMEMRESLISSGHLILQNDGTVSPAKLH